MDNLISFKDDCVNETMCWWCDIWSRWVLLCSHGRRHDVTYIPGGRPLPQVPVGLWAVRVRPGALLWHRHSRAGCYSRTVITLQTSYLPSLCWTKLWWGQAYIVLPSEPMFVIKWKIDRYGLRGLPYIVTLPTNPRGGILLFVKGWRRIMEEMYVSKIKIWCMYSP